MRLGRYNVCMQTASHARQSLRTHGFAHPTRNVEALDIEAGMKIADFGAGSGAYTLAIAEKLQAGSGKVIAIDVQKDLLRRIHNEAGRRGYHNVEVQWADLEKAHAVKVAPRSLDLVLISNLLFQIEDRSAILHEARRVLHEGGRLVIIDWADSYAGMGPIKKHVVTKDTALALARECGFELLREFDAGAHHYGLVLRLSGHAVRKLSAR